MFFSLRSLSFYYYYYYYYFFFFFFFQYKALIEVLDRLPKKFILSTSIPAKAPMLSISSLNSSSLPIALLNVYAISGSSGGKKVVW